MSKPRTPKNLSILSDHGDQIKAHGPTRTWADSQGQWLAGHAYIDETDATAAEMEAKWGCGRLRLLVDPELREKFDRQRYLFNQAIWHGDLQAVIREAQRMGKAWKALDRKAAEAGAQPLSPEFWEVALKDGTVAVIARDKASAGHVVREGRKVAVYTLDEIGRLLDSISLVNVVKMTFPGATVEKGRVVSDPLDAFHDSRKSLDEPIDDPFSDAIPF
jgi:hypothetical protein